MRLVTIDADKLNWMKITGGCLEWVNEVDLVNAIVTPTKELRDNAIKIDAAYQDGYEQGYEQARFDYKRPSAHWIEHPHECGENWEYSKYECSKCHNWTEYYSDFCPDCGAKMEEMGEKSCSNCLYYPNMTPCDSCDGYSNYNE